MTKRATGEGNWNIEDTMRGLPAPTASAQELLANSAAVEQTTGAINLTSTGFVLSNSSGDYNDNTRTYVYIAIRRGPMKVPTSGTTVFAPALGVATAPSMVSGFPVDMQIGYDRDTTTSNNGMVYTRLTGNVQSLRTNTSGAEQTETARNQFQYMNGINTGNDTSDKVGWMFRRASGYFDVVCYTGTGANRTIAHNLAAVPELMLVKRRSTADSWAVYFGDPTDYLRLNDTQAAVDEISRWNDTAPTSTVFTVGTDTEVNTSGQTYVNYLFATCAGVSKVGTYTGNATLRTINCGFTGGARFVMIKSIDQASDWNVWDTTRGMVSGTDPSLALNTTSAEANYNNVFTIATGFQILATPAYGINNSGENYIFLAIA
jgi:hypothetical protein